MGQYICPINIHKQMYMLTDTEPVMPLDKGHSPTQVLPLKSNEHHSQQVRCLL